MHRHICAGNEINKTIVRECVIGSPGFIAGHDVVECGQLQKRLIVKSSGGDKFVGANKCVAATGAQSQIRSRTILKIVVFELQIGWPVGVVDHVKTAAESASDEFAIHDLHVMRLLMMNSKRAVNVPTQPDKRAAFDRDVAGLRAGCRGVGRRDGYGLGL